MLVLDACALIALFRNEEGCNIIVYTLIACSPVVLPLLIRSHRKIWYYRLSLFNRP